MANSQKGDDLSFYLDFLAENQTIPLIITDAQGNVSGTRNLDENYRKQIDSPDKLQQIMTAEHYIMLPPIHYYKNEYIYVYYKESNVYTGLRAYFDDLINNFFSEIVDNSPSLSAIVTDSAQQRILKYGSQIDTSRINDSRYVQSLIKSMSSPDSPPIKINLGDSSAYVFYTESTSLKIIRLFPVILISLFVLFMTVAYLLFRFARRSEQNRIWVGMSKETAHQLGTPISSLMAWKEILQNENVNPDILNEINKDLVRLENITQRFSKIGSVPTLKMENINEIVTNFIDYFKSRTSAKIKFNMYISENKIDAMLNKHLFEWVLENLCKNAVDAMNGEGTISIYLNEDKKHIYIDISDTGKGIGTKYQKNIFEAGYTTKSRGWGLGLTLARRIINDYHNGKIILKNSATGKGSTFRVKLKK
jgi:signal transduction histidine kinase